MTPSILSPQDSPKKVALAYFAALLGLGLSGASLGPTLPGLAEQTQSALAAVSILFTGRAVGGLLGALWVAKLYDCLSGHRVLAGVLVLGAVTLLVTPLISQLWLLAAIMLLLGIAESSMDVGGNTLLLWQFKQKSAPYLSGLHLMFALGAALSSLLVARVLALTGGIRWVYWGIGLAFLPIAIALTRLPSPAKPAGSGPQSGNGASARTIVFFVLFFYAYVAAEVTYGGWIYSFALHRRVAGEVTAAYLTSVFWFALMLGRLVSIPLAARLKLSTAMRWNFLGAFASLLVVIAGQNNLNLLFLGTFGLGLSFASMFPGMIAYANQHIPVDGRVTGWFMAGSSLGGMTIPWLVGQLFEPVGPQVVPWIVLAVVAVSLIAFLTLYRKSTSRKELLPAEAK